MVSGLAFQDASFSKNNHCWVCGNDNAMVTPKSTHVQKKFVVPNKLQNSISAPIKLSRNLVRFSIDHTFMEK